MNLAPEPTLVRFGEIDSRVILLVDDNAVHYNNLEELHKINVEKPATRIFVLPIYLFFNLLLLEVLGLNYAGDEVFGVGLELLGFDDEIDSVLLTHLYALKRHRVVWREIVQVHTNGSPQLQNVVMGVFIKIVRKSQHFF